MQITNKRTLRTLHCALVSSLQFASLHHTYLDTCTQHAHRTQKKTERPTEYRQLSVDARAIYVRV